MAEANSILSSRPFSSLKISEALDRWIELRRPFLAPRTHIGNINHGKPLRRYLGEMPLTAVTIDTVRDYQRQRMQDGIGASCLNHEVVLLGQVIREADPGLWVAIKGRYKALPLPQTPGIALSEDQARALLETAKKVKVRGAETIVEGITIKPKWLIAWCATVISLNTGAGPGEIRHLRIRDIDIEKRTIHITRGIKNKYRDRYLDLNDDALDAVKRLMVRYQRIAARAGIQPSEDHCLIPHRIHGAADFARPITTWKTAWDQMRAALGMPTLRMYDMRHTALSALAQNPSVPLQAIVDIAGWNGAAMLQRYAHMRRETLRAALLGLPKITTGVPTSTAEASRRPPATEPGAGSPPAVSTASMLVRLK